MAGKNDKISTTLQHSTKCPWGLGALKGKLLFLHFAALKPSHFRQTVFNRHAALEINRHAALELSWFYESEQQMHKVTDSMF